MGFEPTTLRDLVIVKVSIKIIHCVFLEFIIVKFNSEIARSTRSRRVVGSDPIWCSGFFRVSI